LLPLSSLTYPTFRRATDCLARVGGDEFAILLPETDLVAARLVLSDIHKALKRYSHDYLPYGTVSMGAVTFASAATPEAMIAMADETMYAIKRQGKNNIACKCMPSENLTPIVDLFEAHLTVTDLDRAVAFYKDQLALPLAHIFPERKVAFFWIGAPGKAMLGLWEASTMPINVSLHVAFQVTLLIFTIPRRNCETLESSPETSPASRPRSPSCWPGCLRLPSTSATQTITYWSS
jgi:hypothetical protein